MSLFEFGTFASFILQTPCILNIVIFAEPPTFSRVSPNNLVFRDIEHSLLRKRHDTCANKQRPKIKNKYVVKYRSCREDE